MENSAKLRSAAKNKSTGGGARALLVFQGSNEEKRTYGISITVRRSTLGSDIEDFSSPISWIVTRSALISFLTWATSCSFVFNTSNGFFIVESPLRGGLTYPA